MKQVDAVDVPLALVGNSLAVLVAATERARRGARTLVINPGGPWGGYFAGVGFDGRRWDAGMVLHEFTAFNAGASAPALAGYDAMRRNDVGRFCHLVHDYVTRHHATREVAPPQMWLAGRLRPDLLLSNAIDALADLPGAASMREEMASQVLQAANAPWHARRKSDWPVPEGAARGSQAAPCMDVDAASRLNHGHHLHEALFAPFAHKVLNRDASHLVARYHRMIWLPMLWPETVLAGLQGSAPALPPTVFSQPVGATVAELSAQLAEDMLASPSLTVWRDKPLNISREPAGFSLQLQSGESVRAARLAWALSPEQGLSACGGPAPVLDPTARLGVMLVFLRLPTAALRRNFSVVHAVSADTGLYRVSCTSNAAGLSAHPPLDSRQHEHQHEHQHEQPDVTGLVVEANPEVFAAHHGPLSDDAAVARAAWADLACMGLVDARAAPLSAHVLRLPTALPLPTAAATASFFESRHELRGRLPGVELIGASAGPFATSLSDQIVQGLQLAESLDPTPGAFAHAAPDLSHVTAAAVTTLT